MFVCYVPLPCFFVINFLSYQIFLNIIILIKTNELYPTFMDGLKVLLFFYLKGSNLLEVLIFLSILPFQRRWNWDVNCINVVQFLEFQMFKNQKSRFSLTSNFNCSVLKCLNCYCKTKHKYQEIPSYAKRNIC